MPGIKEAYFLVDDFICMTLNRMPQKTLDEIFHDLGMMEEHKGFGFTNGYDIRNLDTLLTAIEILKPVLEKEWKKEQ